MSELPNLKRDGTMAVTAQEGEAFLQSQGMTVTDDDAKTRAQREKLDEITSSTSDENGTDVVPKVVRDSTMTATAEEGKELLGGEELEKTRGQTAALKEAEAEEPSPTKPAIMRDSTMAVTASEGKELLDGEELEKTRGQTAALREAEAETTEDGSPAKVKRTTTIAQTTEESTHILGSDDLGRTRSQTRKISESDDRKPTVKRAGTMAQTAKEGEEFLAREAKRAKIDGEEDEDVPVEPDAVTPEA